MSAHPESSLVADPDAASRDKHWYALRTRSRHEAVVKRELELVDVEAFLPMITRWRRWKDRKKQVEFPLFPGYCFARFHLDSRLTVLKRRGLASIVSVAGVPAPIPDVEVESVRQLVESDLKYDPCPMLDIGGMVEVAHGPLQGVVGRLVGKGPRARLVLSVEMISQAVSVEVDAADVKRY